MSSHQDVTGAFLIKVFLTGATGFVGSHVLERLLHNGHHVQYIKRSGTDDWRIREFSTHPLAQAVTGDLDNIDSLSDEIAGFKPEAVLHLAWQGVTSKERNKTEQSENLIRTIKLLEITKRNEIKTFIGLGSQAEYGHCANIITEEHETNPDMAYGIAKLAAYKETQDFCNKENIRFAWLRLFSSYGPKDSPDFLVPYLISCFLNGTAPKLTACEQLWDYIYVSDVAAAVVSVLEHQEAAGIFNLGSGEAVPLKNVVKTIRDAINPVLPMGLGEVPYGENQIMHLQADVEKLRKQTGWRPCVTLHDGLCATAAWYQRHLQDQVNKKRFDLT